LEMDTSKASKQRRCPMPCRCSLLSCRSSVRCATPSGPNSGALCNSNSHNLVKQANASA
jgi:hypothetical protein